MDESLERALSATKTPSVGETWETDWSDGRVRRAVVEKMLPDGRIQLRFLDDRDVAVVDPSALVFTPGSRWRPVVDAK